MKLNMVQVLIFLALAFLAVKTSAKHDCELCGYKATQKTFQQSRNALIDDGYCAMYKSALESAMSANLAQCDTYNLKEHRLSVAVLIRMRTLSRCTALINVAKEFIKEVKEYRTPNIDADVVKVLLNDKRPDEASIKAIDEIFNKCEPSMDQMMANRKEHNYCKGMLRFYKCGKETYDHKNELARTWNQFIQTTELQQKPANVNYESCLIQ